jgi:hypothetical protein
MPPTISPGITGTYPITPIRADATALFHYTIQSSQKLTGINQ